MTEYKELITVTTSCMAEANPASPQYWAIALALVECGYHDPYTDIYYINITNTKTGQRFTFWNDDTLVKWQIDQIEKAAEILAPVYLDDILIELDHELLTARIV